VKRTVIFAASGSQNVILSQVTITQPTLLWLKKHTLGLYSTVQIIGNLCRIPHVPLGYEVKYIKKGKVVPLRSTETQLGVRRYSSYSSLTSALEGGGLVSVMPRPRFTPGERAPGTHCIGCWVGPRAGLDAEVRGKILCLCRG
jgi:hypothetical protein